MLIDINAYIGHWPFRQLQYNTCSGMLQHMNRFGTDVAVVSNINGIFYQNVQTANEELAQQLKANTLFAKRFIPFAVINPIYAGWKNDLTTSIKKLGMRGIRLYPQYHDYEITDPACVELVTMARDQGIPVAFTMRMVDSRERSWLDIDLVSGTAKPEWNLKNILPIIKQVPDAQYMVLNFANNPALTDEELAIVKKTNLLFDTSGRSITKMADFLTKFGNEKFAFGTHAPFLDYLTGLLRIDSLEEAEGGAPVREQLRWGNAKKMLGL
ncbi:MAG TPA: amidohydrolase family protein [Flavihumibacter sp.]|nr:amidohydrolase family protein [Flavihumibacter sp.]